MPSDMGGVTDPWRTALLGGNALLQAPIDASSSRTNCVCTAGTPAHVKGAWAEVIGSLLTPCNVMYLTINVASATALTALVDIAVGPPGGEIIIADNLFICRTVATTDTSSITYTFPIRLPAGARVSARAQASTAATVFTVGFLYSEVSPFRDAYAGVVSAGADTSASSVSINIATNATTAHTKTAWFAVTPVFPRDIELLIIGNLSTSGISTGFNFLFDLATSNTERPILREYWGAVAESNSTFSQSLGPLPVWLPANTALNWRAQFGVVNASSSFRIGLYGCYR